MRVNRRKRCIDCYVMLCLIFIFGFLSVSMFIALDFRANQIKLIVIHLLCIMCLMLNVKSKSKSIWIICCCPLVIAARALPFECMMMHSKWIWNSSFSSYKHILWYKISAFPVPFHFLSLSFFWFSSKRQYTINILQLCKSIPIHCFSFAFTIRIRRSVFLHSKFAFLRLRFLLFFVLSWFSFHLCSCCVCVCVLNAIFVITSNGFYLTSFRLVYMIRNVGWKTSTKIDLKPKQHLLLPRR